MFSSIWTSLTLLNSQAPAVGWDEPYEYVLLIVSILHFIAFVIWESKGTASPILPLDIWSAPSFPAMILASFFAFMSVGITIWYIAVWNLEVHHFSLLLNAASYTPLAVCGTCAAFIAAKLIRWVAAEHIMVIGAMGSCVAAILIATMPAQQLYWAQMFPAVILTAFGPDLLFTAAQIIASNTVKRNQQGIAGSLIGTLLSYGLSTGLGFAGTVEAYTNHQGRNPVKGYRGAMYVGIGLAAAAAVLALLFVRIPKDQRDGWEEDDPAPEMSVEPGQKDSRPPEPVP
jgi:MFS family permease